MADLAIQFGQRVKHLRGALGMTQARLAELVGMSVEWVRRIERGKASPSFTTIAALAQALGVSPAELFGDQSIKRSEQLAAALETLSGEQALWLAEGIRLLRKQ